MASPIAPLAGFSIKLNGPYQTRYYINVCSYEALGRPIDAQDRPVSDEHIESLGIDNLRVPLLTGPARTVEVGAQQDSEAVVMDVVFHPSVVIPALLQPDPEELELDNLLRRRAILGRMMRARLVELAVKNVEDDLRMKLGRDMKLPRGLTYVGGLGEKKTKPVPMTALKQLVQQSFEAEKRRKLEAAPGPWRSTRASVGLDNRRAPPLVSELATGEEAGLKDATRREIVKKGFFNSNKKPLYPEGSTEGTPPPGAGDPLGWMPPKLRSRVAMVDTNNMIEAEQRKMMEDHAAPKPVGYIPTDSKSTTISTTCARAAPEKTVVNAPVNTANAARTQGAQSSQTASDSTVGSFSDSTFGSFTADLADEAARIAETTDPKAFLQQMEALAGSMGIADSSHEVRGHEHSEQISHHSSSLDASTASGKGNAEASCCATIAEHASTALAPSSACACDYTLVEEAGQVVLRVPLRNVSSMAEVEADISDDSFSLRAPGTQLRLEWPCKLDSSAATARFLRKKGVLQVTLPTRDIV